MACSAGPGLSPPVVAASGWHLLEREWPLEAVDNLLCQLYLNQRALGAIPGTAEAHLAPFRIFRFGLTWCPEHTVRSLGMEFRVGFIKLQERFKELASEGCKQRSMKWAHSEFRVLSCVVQAGFCARRGEAVQPASSCAASSRDHVQH